MTHATWIYGFGDAEWVNSVEIERLKMLNFDCVFLSVGDPSKLDNQSPKYDKIFVAKLKPFITSARNMKIEVHVISNDEKRGYFEKGRSDLNPNKKGVAVAAVTAIKNYNIQNPSERFDGIHIDVEPHVEDQAWPGAWANLPKQEKHDLMEQYCLLMEALAQKNAGTMTVSAAVSYWYVDLTTDAGFTRNVIADIATHLDWVVNMSYDGPGNTKVFLGNPQRPDIDNAARKMITQAFPQKVVLGIGGWSYDTYFQPVSATSTPDVKHVAIDDERTQLLSDFPGTTGTAVYAYRHWLPLAAPFIAPWGHCTMNDPEWRSNAVYIERNGKKVSNPILDKSVPNKLKTVVRNFGSKAAEDVEVTFSYVPWGAGFTDFKVIGSTPKVTIPPAIEVVTDPSTGKKQLVKKDYLAGVDWFLDPDDSTWGTFIKALDHFCVHVELTDSSSTTPKVSTINCEPNKAQTNFWVVPGPGGGGPSPLYIVNPSEWEVTDAKLLLSPSTLPDGFHVQLVDGPISGFGEPFTLAAKEQLVVVVEFRRPDWLDDKLQGTDIVANISLEIGGVIHSGVSAMLWPAETAED